jgi:hypothetical protein
MQKPPGIFDREFEWAELSRFVSYKSDDATLGVVSGRRRQGKTFLLDAMCEATGGFYFAATEATETESLRQFGATLARHVGRRSSYRFEHWDEAISELMSTPTHGEPWPVVLDEFPFLVKASPELPSLLQQALGPSARRGYGPVRLLLCGSAMSFMGNLLVGTAPLRGRASLELVIPTLDYRLAADFWQITDLQLALLVTAVVGGTPAYAREFTLGDAPNDLEDFGPWIQRNVLNPSRPLFREARFLLAEDPELRGTALYQGVLSAIAEGNCTRGRIANYLGRKSTDLGHALTVLIGAGMITRDQDAFHSKRSTYRITEPILTFYHAIMRPEWSDLERPGHAKQVWERAEPTFLSKVVGPRFEQVCRSWTQWYADPAATLGGNRTRVQSGVVPDPAARTGHEVDVVVFGQGDLTHERLLAVGEAKWNQAMGISHVQRLQHIRELLRARTDIEAQAARLLCFSGSGFTTELRDYADRSKDVELIDLDRLYHGT